MWKRLKPLAAAVAVAGVLLAGCAEELEQQKAISRLSTSTSTPPAPTAEDLARAQIPEQQRDQVASLMMVGVANYDQALDALNQGVGGIFIGSWTDENLLTEPGRNIEALREAVGRDFSVSIDFEGGRVQRATNILGDFPSPRVMAQTMTPEQVEDLAEILGTGLAAHGVTVNFAPVVDVDAWGLPVVGDRSFSNDPAVAATYATAFAKGLSKVGITPVFKHFPGHGRASGDSHTQDVVTPALDELKTYDLIPYGQALSETDGAVMVGHMIVPGLGTDGVPSSIDPATYQLLRSGDYPGGVPFDGVIYTDDLSGMSAISATHSPAEAVLASLKAGADQALWIDYGSLGSAIDRVDAAVSSGEYPQEQMLASALRVQLLYITRLEKK
ncbi:beta-N-acetylglucosaminidase [[Brevibacterium] flavum]|uniref:beta-N-acetylhexosaminidase n=1 Tax=[Brevibacterium] flavum TaxID=92706 RepID=A0A0F6Z749_9CORY|nr:MULTISPECIES: glycoside hydrolase family 3 protein [Corynebacterium]AJE68443.1 beta-N-acetylglucosaminidase [Corynebacterium glutamicum]AKF28612.1 beta-N-acetylglucosaminidase [[Brevibacterium] flavum]ALP51232.1 beta-N-acetylglucosaminidase [Corynebacterium glutamicum]ANE09466.1 beta-N-acetylglucosaminidase [Corynebacterium glutamicum]ANU34759.1 beta-N-acetylglucosaminidase [Corynebacterium glutamicum]